MKPRHVPIGQFKQTCLRLIDEVRRTSHPILITKRGKPVAVVVPVPRDRSREAWRGCMQGSGRILGDLVAPALAPDAWEALGR